VKGKRRLPEDFMGSFLSGKPSAGPVPEVSNTGTGNKNPVPERYRKSKVKPTIIRLDPEDHAALEREASARGTSLAAIVRALVREHLRGGIE
jgi:hypothetical protein